MSIIPTASIATLIRGPSTKTLVESSPEMPSPSRMLGLASPDKKNSPNATIADEEGKPMIKKSDRTVNENAQWAQSSVFNTSHSNLQLTLSRQSSNSQLPVLRQTSNPNLK